MFSPIRLLSPEMVHRIAAGEVVDRPASVLKELVENSLDAGANKVKILIKGGGISKIQVDDNGCGFSKADLEVALRRHATSKISQVDDLDSIQSLGFRGEALSAISAVSKFKIETHRVSDSTEKAWRLNVNGGVREDLVEVAPRVGTSIHVEELFFNVPARRKFLKKASSEAAECERVLEALACAHEHCAFEWHIINDQGEVKKQMFLEASSFSHRFEKICSVKGRLLEVQESDDKRGIFKLHIAALYPPAALSNSSEIRLSVNGRAVSDKRLPFALREAYAGLIEVGAYPCVAVKLEVDPSLIDVNIHPQKKEIRWPPDYSLASVVYRSLRPHFELKKTAQAEVSQDTSSHSHESLAFNFGPPSSSPSPLIVEPLPQLSESFVPLERNNLKIGSSPSQSLASFLPHPQALPNFKFSELCVVGEVGAAWIVCEAPEGLLLIDQHAAHERISFESILKKKNLFETQPLAMPLAFELPYQFEDLRAEVVASLETLGFEVSDIPPPKTNVIEIIAIPLAERSLDWAKILRQLLQSLESGGDAQGFKQRLEVEFASSLACHGSVRRGQRLTNPEIRELLEQLDRVEWRGLCPHGRPVWFTLPHEKIEALFHR